jgi:hypothetical protein
MKMAFAADLQILLFSGLKKMGCRIMDCKKKNYFVKKFLETGLP